MSDENNKGITNELITEILSYVKLELDITNTSQDDILTLYIKAICTNILTLTNRRKFVEDLKYVVVDLVKDKFDLNNGNTADSDIQSVQSMSEAGRSVNFGVSNVIANRLNIIAQKQLNDNQAIINKYKLLYKT